MKDPDNNTVDNSKNKKTDINDSDDVDNSHLLPLLNSKGDSNENKLNSRREENQEENDNEETELYPNSVSQFDRSVLEDFDDVESLIKPKGKLQQSNKNDKSWFKNKNTNSKNSDNTKNNNHNIENVGLENRNRPLSGSDDNSSKSFSNISNKNNKKDFLKPMKKKLLRFVGEKDEDRGKYSLAHGGSQKLRTLDRSGYELNSNGSRRFYNNSRYSSDSNYNPLAYEDDDEDEEDIVVDADFLFKRARARQRRADCLRMCITILVLIGTLIVFYGVLKYLGFYPSNPPPSPPPPPPADQSLLYSSTFTLLPTASQTISFTSSANPTESPNNDNENNNNHKYNYVSDMDNVLLEDVSTVLLNNGTHDFKPSTIFVSLDGFHPRYLSEKYTPNLMKLANNGITTPYMKPSFPSLTFPNHYTLVTGLYPSVHGIVANKFYDPSGPGEFSRAGQVSNIEWWGGEPLWVTAELNNVTTAVHMWPGSEADWPEHAGKPTIVDKFNKTEPLDFKVNRISSYLDEGDINVRPQLMLFYVPTIDTLGHAYGVHGPEIANGLVEVDDMIGSLIDHIDARNLSKIVNIVVVSDHGMAPTSNDRLFYLDEMIDMDILEHWDGWPLVGLRLNDSSSQDGGLEKTYKDLLAIRQSYDKDPNNPASFNVYYREEMPEEYHFGNPPANTLHAQNRIAPLWIVPDAGWVFTTHAEMSKMNNDYHPRGLHGFNNSDPLMRSLFIGYGPYFNSELLDDNSNNSANVGMVQPFENVEMYGIICRSLGLVPAANNGSDSEISNVKYIDLDPALKLIDSDWKDLATYPPFIGHPNEIIENPEKESEDKDEDENLGSNSTDNNDENENDNSIEKLTSSWVSWVNEKIKKIKKVIKDSAAKILNGKTKDNDD